MLGVLASSLRRNVERVLPRRMGEFVHEAFEIERVLVVVDAAPEPRRHRRVAHRVVDQEVRDRIAEDALRAARVQAPGRSPGSRPFCRPCGLTAGEDRLAGDAHVQADEVAVRIERADEPRIASPDGSGRGACPLRATRSA